MENLAKIIDGFKKKGDYVTKMWVHPSLLDEVYASSEYDKDTNTFHGLKVVKDITQQELTIMFGGDS